MRADHRSGIFAGTVVLAAFLLSTLTACGAQSSASEPAGDHPPRISSQAGAASLEKALTVQAAAQNTAAEDSAAESGALRTAALFAGNGGLCTTDPADRQNCRNPGGTIDPNGGDLDGDGVFEQNEPVGPGYKDPRAYDGGRTSGETQCEWLRSQGIAC
ncbi:hypothetical protein [Streptomyces peucetius]|uniref:Calcium-binding protein n=1 Tax=Streptomyces peucetius TaxID=1950 RepID=A0ABY6I5I0_STRPE|nr:hypothetical protein [Streptomyces peucetius]UYQ62238.1 hypothetical protein OGH68_12600 [Streptomyces peucetius]